MNDPLGSKMDAGAAISFPLLGILARPPLMALPEYGLFLEGVVGVVIFCWSPLQERFISICTMYMYVHVWQNYHIL